MKALFFLLLSALLLQPIPVHGITEKSFNFGLPGRHVVEISTIEKLAAQGLISNVEIIHKFGRNNAIASAAVEDIWSNGGAKTELTAPTLLEVKSTDPNDTFNGSGARIVRVFGLDANWAAITEDFTLNGTTFVQGTKQFLRVNRMRVVSRGTYGSLNAGTITARKDNDLGTGDVLAEISVDADFGGDGGTFQSHYTVPAGKGALIYYVLVATEASKPMRLAVNIRTNENDNLTTAPFLEQSFKHFIFDEVSGFDEIDIQHFPYFLAPKTDIWWSAIATGTTGSISVNYGMLVFDLNST